MKQYNIKNKLNTLEEYQHYLYTTYYKDVFRTAYYVVKNIETAKELTNEAYFKAFVNLNSLNDNEKFRQWICTIVANLARNHLKRNKRFTIVNDIETLDNICYTQYSAVEEIIENKETMNEIREILKHLDDNSREVLVLRYYNYMSYQAISDILTLKMGTVKARINRAKEKLLKQLQAAGDEK